MKTMVSALIFACCNLASGITAEEPDSFLGNVDSGKDSVKVTNINLATPVDLGLLPSRDNLDWLTPWVGIQSRHPIAYLYNYNGLDSNNSMGFLDHNGNWVGKLASPPLCKVSASPDGRYTAFASAGEDNNILNVSVINNKGQVGNFTTELHGGQLKWTARDNLVFFCDGIWDDGVPQTEQKSSTLPISVKTIQYPIEGLIEAGVSDKKSYCGFHRDYSILLAVTIPFHYSGAFWIDNSFGKSGVLVPEENVQEMSASPDGKYIAVISSTNIRKMFIIRSSDESTVFRCPMCDEDFIGALSWRPNSHIVAFTRSAYSNPVGGHLETSDSGGGEGKTSVCLYDVDSSQDKTYSTPFNGQIDLLWSDKITF